MIINNIPCESAFIIDKDGKLIAALSEDDALHHPGYTLILSSDPENDLRITRDMQGYLNVECKDDFNTLS